jgi:APA family basic amino acid/polyamine antiporter
LLGWNAEAVAANFGDLWTPRGNVDIATGLSAATAFGLFVGLCVAQTGSLFSSDAWNNITFTAGEVKDPRRNLPLALALGTGLVTALYLLANVAYLVTLPLAAIQQAPADRVATATLDTIVPGLGATLMAAAILISTFGCNADSSGRARHHAMARDSLFFKRVSAQPAKVPRRDRYFGVWSVLLVLPRTYDPVARTYGNLYGNLLDYVISAALIFYILTIAGIFRLRRRDADAVRPMPVVPALSHRRASRILLVLCLSGPPTWPGW